MNVAARNGAPNRLSFRDPEGSVFEWNEKIVRLVSGSPSRVNKILSSPELAPFRANGTLIGTSFAHEPQKGEFATFRSLDPKSFSLLEHPKIWFPNYPTEWPAEMLYAAATLTLDLAVASLKAGLELKDASAYNLVFQGPTPVFVDILSFADRDPHKMIWEPLGQFARHFLLPLLAYREFKITPDTVWQTHKDGITPEEVYAMLHPLRRWFPRNLKLVTLPTLLGRSRGASQGKIYVAPRLASPERALFTVEHLLGRARGNLRSVAPKPCDDSTWSSYMQTDLIYTQELFDTKKTLIRDVLETRKPQTVLDIGCNTGEFSLLSARAGAKVVGIDYDAACVGKLFTMARKENLPILSLVGDVGRPAPSVGWFNSEHRSFLDRAEQRFDLVLMLALLHHLTVTDRVPYDEVIRLAAHVSRRDLVIEYVGITDPQLLRIAMGRDVAHLTKAEFERSLQKRFRIERQHTFAPLDRTLYICSRS